MVVLEHPPAFRFQAVAAVVGELPDVRLGAGEGEDVLHPAVGVAAGEDAVLPDGVEQPVRLDPLVAQVPVGQRPLRLHGPGMDAHIGVAFRVAAADIQVFVQRLFLMDVGCLPEHGAAAAVGASDPCGPVLCLMLHSYPSSLCCAGSISGRAPCFVVAFLRLPCVWIK